MFSALDIVTEPGRRVQMLTQHVTPLLEAEKPDTTDRHRSALREAGAGPTHCYDTTTQHAKISEKLSVIIETLKHLRVYVWKYWKHSE